jgi:hypothetical protein
VLAQAPISIDASSGNTAIEGSDLRGMRLEHAALSDSVIRRQQPRKRTPTAVQIEASCRRGEKGQI